MKKECPFCWDHNVRGLTAISGNGLSDDQLMFCDECERWYLAETGEEVTDLAELCLTIVHEPEKCIEDVLYPLRNGFLPSATQKAIELNLLCTECPHSCFLLMEQPAPHTIAQNPAMMKKSVSGKRIE